MSDNFDNRQSGEGYDAYHFSTPLDPAPIEPEEMKTESAESAPESETPVSESADMGWEPSSVQASEPVSEPSSSTYAYTFRKATPKPEQPDMPPEPEIPLDSLKKKKKKKSSGIFKKILVCVLLAIVFGAVSGGVFLGIAKGGMEMFGYELVKESNDIEIPKVETIVPDDVEDTVSTPVSTTSNGELTVAQVAERCMPAMVAITTTSITEVPNFFGYGSQSYESTGSGSGIIIDQNDQELLIATNNHVVAGASTLTVCFVDETLVEGIIKGTDAENDLAIVSVKLTDIPAETREQIKVIQIGNSDELKVGEQVVAIGNALGYGQSVSSGWVSALNREVSIDGMTLTLVQTDAAINPGNSGGALLNMKGELIGINESKYADTYVEGMGYAIPVSTATPILSELMSKETRYKVDADQASYIGITCKDISSDFATMYNVPTGVYVDSCEEGGPAANAGIKKGDIITEFDGTKLGSYADLVGQLEYYAAGEIVEVTICRADNGEYKEQVVYVTLGSRNATDFLSE